MPAEQCMTYSLRTPNTPASPRVSANGPEGPGGAEPLWFPGLGSKVAQHLRVRLPLVA